MDHAVVGHDVRGGDFCFVDHDAASGGDGEFRALHGFNFARFDICSHHLAGDHMVAEQDLFHLKVYINQDYLKHQKCGILL